VLVTVKDTRMRAAGAVLGGGRSPPHRAHRDGPGGVWQLVRRETTRAPRDLHRLPGTATRSDGTRAASAKAPLARSPTPRRSLPCPAAAGVSCPLGPSQGRALRASVAASVLELGPPRSGKGLHVVINTILAPPRGRHPDLDPPRQPHRNHESARTARTG